MRDEGVATRFQRVRSMPDTMSGRAAAAISGSGHIRARFSVGILPFLCPLLEVVRTKI